MNVKAMKGKFLDKIITVYCGIFNVRGRCYEIDIDEEYISLFINDNEDIRIQIDINQITAIFYGGE